MKRILHMVILGAIASCTDAPGAFSSGSPVSDTSSSGSVAGGSSGAGSSGSMGAPGNGLLPGDAGWQATSEWYRTIDTAAVAEHSSAMLSGIDWGNQVFQIDFSFVVLTDAGPTTPTSFQIETLDESDDVQVPVPNVGYLEGENAYDACPSGEDCHLLVVSLASRKLFEVYGAHKVAGMWQASSIALWQFDKKYPRTARGQGCTSGDAAGLAIAPGLIGLRETQAGNIAHALRFTLQNSMIRKDPNVAYPATHGTRAGTAAMGPPYGARLRLRATFDEGDARVVTPGAKALVKALKKYGMILADGGRVPLMAESDRVYRDASTTETGWNGLLGPRDLGFIRPSDFEVVGIPKDAPDVVGAGYFSSQADYEAQLKAPLGCKGIVQP